MSRYKIEMFVENRWGGRFGDATATIYASSEEDALEKIKKSFNANGGKGTSFRIAK